MDVFRVVSFSIVMYVLYMRANIYLYISEVYNSCVSQQQFPDELELLPPKGTLEFEGEC